MATNYSQIGYGSSGNDVKTLQQMLKSNGYQLDVDGNFGPKTQEAVKDYQKKNNLAVDGIVGKNTWSSLNATASSAAPTGSQPAPEADAQTSGGYTPSETVQQAQSLLEQHMANKPGEYNSQYSAQIQQIMDKILNREKFSYDLNSDAIYQQYAQQYAQQGKMAMMDTMGQAAAMTGGYGNSYAQSVGQQTYQGYMQQLNEVMPELYGMALDRYNQEGDEMLNQYGLLVSQDEQEYGRYRDQVSDYNTELARLTDDARYKAEDEYGKWIDERNYNYQQGRDAVADQQWAAEFAEAQRQFNEKMTNSGSSSGGGTEAYVMSTEDYDYWNNQWAMVQSEADAEALAERMEAAGVPFELAALWYKWYTGGYEKDEKPQGTDVVTGKSAFSMAPGGRRAFTRENFTAN